MRRAAFILLSCLLVAGCSRTVLTEPNLILTKQPEHALAAPVMVAVSDDEADNRGTAYAADLLQSIRAAYPGAVAAAPSGAPLPGRVTVTIHIQRLGAYFDTSKLSQFAGEHGLGTPTGEVGDWSTVVAAAQSHGPLVSGTVYKYLPGNWVGLAEIEVAVRDLRPGHRADFVLPLAAVRTRQNDLGYVAARLAAGDAWDEVSPRLAAFLDAAVGKVAAEARG